MKTDTRMPDAETDLLADLIHRKLHCLLHLYELGKRQLEFIDTGNMAALLDLLAVKQRSLVDLQKLESGLDPFRGQDPEKRRWRTQEDRARCAEQARQCEGVLAAVLEQERRGERLLVARRDETTKQLQGAHLASRARHAYLASPDVPVGQLDLESD